MSRPKEPLPLDDAALEDYLRGDSPVSQQYRALPDDVPPPALDRQVLAQARAAIGAKPVAARPRWVRWGAPMAVAASAVMALSIVMQGGLQEAEVALSTRMLDEVAAPAAIEPDAAADVASAVEAAPEQEAASSDFAATTPSQQSEIHAPAARVERPAVPAQPAQQRDQDARGRDAVDAASEKRRVLSAPARTQRERERRAAPESAVSADAPVATQSAGHVLLLPPDAVPPPPAVMAPPAPVTGATPQTAPPPARPMAAPATTPSPSVLSAKPVEPEAWLSEIRRLRLDGEGAAADREWQRFRKAFPEYAVTDADPARPAQCRGGC